MTTDHYLDMIQEDEIESDIVIRESYTSVFHPNLIRFNKIHKKMKLQMMIVVFS